MYYYIAICMMLVQINTFAQPNKNTALKATYKSTVYRSLYSALPNKNTTYVQYFSSKGYTYQVNQQYSIDQLTANAITADDKEAIATVGDEILRKLNTPSVNIYKAGTKYFTTTSANNDNKYCTQMPVEEIDWTLLPDTSTVLGFMCHKAVCTAPILSTTPTNFEAWYTTAIALPYGPFKLKGLPGLILKATSKYYSYEIVDLTAVPEQEVQKSLQLCQGKQITSTEKMSQQSFETMKIKSN